MAANFSEDFEDGDVETSYQDGYDDYLDSMESDHDLDDLQYMEEEYNRDFLLECQEMEDFEGMVYDDFPAGDNW